MLENSSAKSPKVTEEKSTRDTMKLSGPEDSTTPAIELRTPEKIAPNATITITPTPTPRIVSPERILLSQITATAIAMPSHVELSQRRTATPEYAVEEPLDMPDHS